MENTNMKFPFKEIVASIKVTPIDSTTANYTVSVPIWVSKQPCGREMITLTAFGGILIVAEKGEDVVQKALSGIKAFFEISNKYGKGVSKELELLGWNMKKSRFKLKQVVRKNAPSKNNLVSEFSKPDGFPLYPQMMQQEGYNQTVECVI
jgi:hypothetical protein